MNGDELVYAIESQPWPDSEVLVDVEGCGISIVGVRFDGVHGIITLLPSEDSMAAAMRRHWDDVDRPGPSDR